MVRSDKRDIRNYLLANGIEVSGINDKTIRPTKEDLYLGKSDLRFNFRKFDIIDTEEKAYWLGFIFADGCIGEKTFTFELCLQASDVVHLHKFNRFMECSDNNVHYHYKETENKTYDSYRWFIRNENLWNTLNSYGCIPNKSLVLEFPNQEIFKNKLLIKHFIRGYWDGDGCISPTTKIISVLGTESFLNNMKPHVPTIANNKLYNRKCKSGKTFVIQTGTRKAYETLRYLYEEAAICLDRKYEKYQEFCRIYK